jgi:hypothetical protein
MSFMEILQPSLKFLRQERERQRMDVAYPTNGGNPPMDIDLDAGTATIVVRVPTETADDSNQAPTGATSPTSPTSPTALAHDVVARRGH